MGTEVSQIACGKKHTLALVPSRGRLYSFGLGGCGQLGNNSFTSATNPQVVHGPWIGQSDNSSQKTVCVHCIGKLYSGSENLRKSRKKTREIK